LTEKKLLRLKGSVWLTNFPLIDCLIDYLDLILDYYLI